MCDEVLPGDTINTNWTFLARLSTSALKTPLMDNMYLDSFAFFIPNRLLWAHWENMCGAQANPGDSTDYLVPIMTAPASTGHVVGSLSDYLGIPTGIAGLQHTSLFHRAYALCWNQWFRDQNLQDATTFSTGDGPDTPSDYPLLKRGKRHDYFTSCLPWPQKPLAAYPNGVTLPLGSLAPVMGNGKDLGLTNGTDTFGMFFSAGSDKANARKGLYNVNVGTNYTANNNVSPTDAISWGVTTVANESGLVADLSSATAAFINQIRLAFQIQKLAERDARSGTRYCEILDAHFGVTHPSHAVLQRPQYLGGGSAPISISPIAQTSGTGAYQTYLTFGIGAHQYNLTFGGGAYQNNLTFGIDAPPPMYQENLTFGSGVIS